MLSKGGQQSQREVLLPLLGVPCEDKTEQLILICKGPRSIPCMLSDGNSGSVSPCRSLLVDSLHFPIVSLTPLAPSLPAFFHKIPQASPNLFYLFTSYLNSITAYHLRTPSRKSSSHSTSCLLGGIPLP